MAHTDLFPEVAPRIDGEMANDRYTTRATLDWCKRVLGVEAFDLDVAACREAHHAPRYFTVADDGLKCGWIFERIWCNPPYDVIGPWIAKAWETMLEAAVHGRPEPVIGMLIPDNRREQPFWQRLVEPFRDGRWERVVRPPKHVTDAAGLVWVAHDYGARLFTHSLPGRQPFGVPGNPEGIGQQSPPFGVVLLEWRWV